MHKIGFLMGTFISNRGSAPFLISAHIHSRVFLWVATTGMALSVIRWSEWSTLIRHLVTKDSSYAAYSPIQG